MSRRPRREGEGPTQLPLALAPKPRPMRTIALSMLLLSGCANTQVAYDKPGTTQAVREQDMNECVRAAMGTSKGWWPLFVLYQIDREDYGRCLEARGYTVTPIPSPGRHEPVQAP